VSISTILSVLSALASAFPPLAPILSVLSGIVDDIGTLFPSKNAQRDVKALALYTAAKLGGSTAIPAAQALYNESAAGNPTHSPAETVTDAMTYWTQLVASGWTVANGTVVAPVALVQ
jgi:hypothetical protein